MAEAPSLTHPREAWRLERGEAVEAAFLEAVERGRLHHAWLLCGPEGIGKASFAYRAARRLLAARPDPSFGLLGAAPDDPVSQLVAARAHPDLMVLERAGEDGKPRKVIPVEEARRLPEFFAKTPAMGAFRVAIIDAVDDMNTNAANALLKTLEEPPSRGVLLLVSHAPGGLLATIRSRCRRLRFEPWPEDDIASFVQARAEANDEQALRLARMAGGAPGRALALAAAGALGVDDAAGAVMAGLDRDEPGPLQALADSFRGAEGAGRFQLLFERLADQARATAVRAAEDGLAAEPWARAWEVLLHTAQDVEHLNLDRADAFWTAVGELRAAQGRA